MKNICKKIALLMIPVVLYLCFFAAFEPNNYFGFKQSAAGTAPIGRIKDHLQQPGDHLILGDSRLAHFDLSIADAASGTHWQNLAFGGASLRETIDLLEYCIDRGEEIDHAVVGFSFYTLSSRYDTDRMSALQDTLSNPLAYIFNLEYNVNTLTGFQNWLAWRGRVSRGETSESWLEAQQEHETADWPEEAYLLPDGSKTEWHELLRQYTETIRPVIADWSVNEDQLSRLLQTMQNCSDRGIRLTIVLPPMHESVTMLCEELGIDNGMAEPLAQLNAKADSLPLVDVLDYEWDELGSELGLEEWQYYDGFHLDTEKGLPIWTEDFFSRLA